jgi:hypothetical protein
MSGPHALPSLKSYGTIGSWFFRHETTDWVVRHVETLEILSARSAARRLTIDLKLPTDPESWIAHDGSEALYCMPVARLAKERPTSFIDLRDEAGDVLPLLTRAENAVISRRALTVSVQALLGRQATIDAALGYGLALVVEEEGIPAEVAAAVYERAMSVRNQLREGPTATRLAQVVTQLSANSMIWVLLRGEPGQRRVIKLAYRIPLKVPVVPARRVNLVEFERLGISIPEEGTVDWLASMRNLASRGTAAMGLDAIDITVHDPVVQDPRSYHFQVRTPTGVRLEEIVPTTFPEGEEAELYVGAQHLYLRGASSGQNLPLQLCFRVHRHGLLNLSLLATSVITALLWLVRSNETALVGAGANVTRAQIAAAVLVLVPAGLAVFANRPTENPLATVLLSGVRWFVVLAALCGAFAAAALGGVRPTGSLQTSLLIYASIASGCLAAMLVAWVGSVRLLREPAVAVRRRLWGDCRYRTHRLFLAGVAVALNGIVALAVNDDWFSSSASTGLGLVAVSVSAAVSAIAVYLIRWAPARRGDKTVADAEGPADVGDLDEKSSLVFEGSDAVAQVEPSSPAPAQHAGSLDPVEETNRTSETTAEDAEHSPAAEDTRTPPAVPGGQPAGLAAPRVPYVPLAMYLAVVLSFGAGIAGDLFLASNEQAQFATIAWVCFGWAAVFAAAVVGNLLLPLAEPPDLSYAWDPWEAAEQALENLDLLDRDATKTEPPPL